MKCQRHYLHKKYKNSDENLVTNENDASSNGSTSSNGPNANTTNGASGGVSTIDDMEKGHVEDINRRWNLKQSVGTTTRIVNPKATDGSAVRERSRTPERRNTVCDSWI